jgi:hypothetical protein
MDADDPARIERRDAMRAALAGATLSALSEPPRIVSLFVAPDVAQARSTPCTPGSATILHPILRPDRQCWGTLAANGTCVDLVIGPHVRGSFTIAASIGGSDDRGTLTSGGHATVTVAGIEPPATCTATLTADCQPAVAQPLPASTRSPARGTPISLPIPADGVHVLGPWSCTGRWPDSVTLTVACRC